MSYSGWLLGEQSKTELLKRFVPRFPDVIAHHVTLNRLRDIPDEVDTAKVVGYATDNVGLETLVVEINGTMVRPDGAFYHITWSIDRSAGYKPVDSKKIIFQEGIEPCDPIPISLEAFYCDHLKVEYTRANRDMIERAKNRCRSEGIDPDFFGTKGFQNWKLFTDEALCKTEAVLADMESLFKPEA